jgi:membrane fusion protein, multidrug efflux system
MVWASGAVLAAILLIVMTGSGAKASVQAPPPPIVEVATVEQRDVPVYGEWIGTLTGPVECRRKSAGHRLSAHSEYKEGSYVRKGELLFEIDPRPFQAVLDQAKAQLTQCRFSLLRFFLTLGAKSREAGEARHEREAVQIRLGHTSGASVSSAD